VHEERWTLSVGLDGTVTFTRPDGTRLSPPASAVPIHTAPLAPTLTRLAASGIAINARTAPVWKGERLDLGWAFAVLRGGEPRPT
jgi:hypothetical protein